MTTTCPAAIPPASAPALRTVFLPREHGSWSFALEPLALGLLAAPSAAGGALALATLAGFFSRRPLNALFASGATSAPSGTAAAATLFSACAVAGLGAASWLGGAATLWPLLLSAPCAALFFHFDRRGDSRAAAAELAGGAAFAFLPAALATLAGWPPATALALAAVMLARTLPTILTIRTCLRLNKRQPAQPILAVLAAGAALGGVLLLAANTLVPWIAAAVALVLLGRTVLFVSPLRPAWSARRIGATEAALGCLYVVVIGLASATVS